MTTAPTFRDIAETFTEAAAESLDTYRERVDQARRCLEGHGTDKDVFMAEHTFEFCPQTPKMEFVVENPRGSNVENPVAALLGHVSRAEQLYLAACWLEAEYDGENLDPAGGPLGGYTTGEQLYMVKHDLRDDAIDAIALRLEHNYQARHLAIGDHATGWKQRISLEMSGDALDHAIEDAPERVLDWLEHEICR